MKALAVAALAAAFAALLCAASLADGGQQTFWSTSSGKPPAPLPTPSSFPVNWYGTPYYPQYWPVCYGDPNRWNRQHCRPPHGHVWPPGGPPPRRPPGRPPR